MKASTLDKFIADQRLESELARERREAARGSRKL